MSKKYVSKNANYTHNNVNQNSWFKDGDFKNHIYNEKNIPITENIINNIFKKYNFNHTVRKLNNFQIAVTHVSYLNKTIVKDKTAKLLKDIEPISDNKKKNVMPLQMRDYNTFEYYGDSVIHLILTQYLYDRYSTKDSGFLTKLRTKIEKAETLSFLSKMIGLDKYVVIGRNMEINNARENDVHLTEDVFESFIWALFLESSYEMCKTFLINVIEKEIDFAELINLDDNYKEKVMQHFHKMKWKEPKYIEKKENRKVTSNCHEQEFVVCLVDEENNILGTGAGNTKSKAEQNSAHDALIRMNVLNVINDDSDSVDYYVYDDGNSNSDSNSNSGSNSNSNSNSDYYDENENEIEWKLWFKDGDYKNHMLNEMNIKIDEKFINDILKKYGSTYKIKNLANFQIAMTHVSYLDKITLKEKTAILLKDVVPITDEKKKKTMKLQKDDYGRLGHLGNAVTRLALTEYLCQRYSMKDQGFLTKLRTKIERAETLSTLASQLKLNTYAVIARNMEQNNARYDDISLMKGVFESFIGALSLENEYDDCKKILINLFEANIDFAELLNQDDNYKEKLMQYFHKMKWKEPIYTDNKNDTDNNNNDNTNSDKKTINQEREFVMYIKNIEGKILGIGTGNTKNKAEQDSAHDVLIKMNVINDFENTGSDYYGEASDSDVFYE